MATHNRMFERQISQVTQQQESPFAPPIIFSGQSKLNQMAFECCHFKEWKTTRWL